MLKIKTKIIENVWKERNKTLLGIRHAVATRKCRVEEQRLWLDKKTLGSSQKNCVTARKCYANPF